MKQTSILFAVALICTAFTVTGCGKPAVSTSEPITATTTAHVIDNTKTDQLAENTALSNPATVYCLEQDGKFTMSKTLDGTTEGLCVLPSNITCEVWSFYRGDCPAGAKKKRSEASTTTTAQTTSTKIVEEPKNDIATDSATSTIKNDQPNNENQPTDGYGAMGRDEQSSDAELILTVKAGEAPGEIITSWKPVDLDVSDGYIIMLSGQEQISYPTKYAHVLKNNQSRSFVWSDLVSGRKYYFRACIAQGDACDTYSQVVSLIAE